MSSNKLLVSSVAFSCGVIFSIGLIVSGMANPAKVLNFLDVFGYWDPSLAFVMGGAVAVTLVGYPLVRQRKSPVLQVQFQWPNRDDIDKPLLLGAVMFGLGWGIGGYCPGPAWTAVSAAAPGTLVFLGAMLIGMLFATFWKNRTT